MMHGREKSDSAKTGWPDRPIHRARAWTGPEV